MSENLIMKWLDGREARTLHEAKELVEAAVVHLDIPYTNVWRASSASKERVFSWEYTDLDVGGREKLAVGVSSGGLVSLNGDSLTPDTRKPNVTLVNVVSSLSAAATSLCPILSFDEKLSSDRIKVYEIANTYSAASQFKLMQDYGLSADWDNRIIDGETKLGISLPKCEVSLLRLLQAECPERWGNPKVDRQQFETNLEDAKEHDAMNSAQREFVDRLMIECECSHELAAHLTDKLGKLSAMHLKLCLMDVGSGLTEQQQTAQECIEQEIRESVRGQPKIKEVLFLYDPRGTTVGVKFDSGAYNSFNGSWKVPLADGAVQALGADFWHAHVSQSPVKVNSESANAESKLVLFIDNTDNAAFIEVGRDEEISRIIKDAAASIEHVTSISDVDIFLRDINGNRVGKVEYTNTMPANEPNEGTLRLSIKTGNSPFDDDAPSEVARILREAASKVRNGEHIFTLRDTNGNTVGKFEFREAPSLEKDGVIDMTEALNLGRVYWAQDGFSGIADGEYRFVVTTPDFEPGYGQGEGEVWLVNAKGETAPGYDDPQSVRETDFRELKTAEKSDLRAVVEGRVSFDAYEDQFSDGEPELRPA